MYESFFGLKKRPFAASPDADVLVETPGVADALERLDLCIRQGRGIGVLTAAAGMGKTHLCHRLARKWGTEFRVALLPNGSFPTPRGLLQAILAELDQPYQRLGETELMLELTAVARVARTRTSGVVLLLDEAHRYTERLLDEVRLIANLVENGEPLVRILLAGHVDLEDKLASPSLTGVNERVGELVTLPRLTLDESRQYLEQRTAYAGASFDNLFEPDAIDVIIRACGGVPRCLNQLADHGLLLGYVAERRPVDEGLVREALDDLKRLPLQWNDPLPHADRADAVCQTKSAVNLGSADSFGSGGSNNIIEIGGLTDEPSNEELQLAKNTSNDDCELVDEVQGTAIEIPAQEATPKVNETARAESEVRSNMPPTSEPVRDRFAQLDAIKARQRWFDDLERAGTPYEGSMVAFESRLPPESSNPEECMNPDTSSAPEECAVPRPVTNPLETLDRVEPLIAEALGELPVEPAPVEQFDGSEEIEELVSALERRHEAVPRPATATVSAEGRVERADGPEPFQPRQIALPSEPPAPAEFSPASRQEPKAAPQRDPKRTQQPAAQGSGQRRSTLFSDLRRRHRELREGRS